MAYLQINGPVTLRYWAIATPNGLALDDAMILGAKQMIFLF